MWVRWGGLVDFTWNDPRVSIESRLLPKIMWEQKVNSKKSKKIFCTKTDLLSKCIPKYIPNYC